MRIVITGGAGFIGSHLADALVACRHDVLVLDNLCSHGSERRENLPAAVEFVNMDIRDPAVAQVIKRFQPDLISHHAAQHSVVAATRQPLYDADVNILGTLNVLEAARSARVRKIMYASTAATYGDAGPTPVSEATPQRPKSPYGITKMIVEQYLYYYRQQFDIEYTILRYGNVFGPRQNPNGEAGVVAIFADKFLRHQSVRIDSDGEQARPYVYVSDVIAANLAALDKGDGETYVIGAEEMTSVNQIYMALVAVMGFEVPIIRAPLRHGDVRYINFDPTKAKRELGWTTRVPLLEGIRLTVEFLRAQGSADGDVAVA